AMIDVTAEKGMLQPCLSVMNILQSVKQARWRHESLLTLPRVEKHMLSILAIPSGRHGRNSKKPTDTNPKTVSRLFDLTSMSEQEVKSYFSKDIWKVVQKLPRLSIDTSIDTGIKSFLVADLTYKVILELNRVRRPGVVYDGRVHCPKFPKPQWESWWAVLEDPDSGELVALKRVNMRTGPQGGFINKVTTRLEFVAPKREGRHVWKLHLYSDGYLGLDQTVDIQFDVMNAS
ncbi:activating signal cointegrator 1 complex subunit, partial [Dissophora globulifera]